MSVKMPWEVAKGEDYGAPVDAVIAFAALRGFTREDFLKLAWAALDQGSTHATAREAEKAFDTIATLLPETETR
jgi:hypothetical protein